MVARRISRNEECIVIQNCIQFDDYCRLYSPSGTGAPVDWNFGIDTKNTTIGAIKLCFRFVPRDEALMLEGQVLSNDDLLVADAIEGKNSQQFCLYSTKCDVVAMPPLPSSLYAKNMKTKEAKKKESNNLLRKVLSKSAEEKMSPWDASKLV